jgi:ABC-type antimicrobial peptide transport system permease subunit
MKALGANARRLTNVVLAQAIWTVGAALALAIALTVALAWLLAVDHRSHCAARPHRARNS